MKGNPIDTDRFQAKASAESHFSWIRTRMSVERTLMAWVRTATALIGFGFTIVQFLQRLQDMQGVAPALRPQAGRFLGLSLIMAGVVALAIATWQYRVLIRYLWSPEFTAVAGVTEEPSWTPLLPVAIGMMLIGIFAFGAVFLRLT